MALNGTISDFGVADIFQLVGQQAKTGVLVFKNDLDTVRVYFRDGFAVHAESVTKSRDRMLGGMLVGAEVITQGQLNQAFTEQRRTLQRLGQVLMDLRYIDADILKEFATLQLTETLYGLFEWKDGTYEFSTEEVARSTDGVEPLKTENIVLNGLRIVDEWPAIRERIPSYLWVVERTRELPGLNSVSEWDGDNHQLPEIDGPERRVFELVGGGRKVQKLIDLSRMGEFETCQALSVLMQGGFIRVIKPTVDIPSGDEDESTSIAASATARAVGRIAISAVTVVLAAFLLASTSRSVSGRGDHDLVYRPDPVSSRLAKTQIKVLRRALELYRFQKGSYPPSLEELVESRFIRPTDMRYPFQKPYFYRVDEAGQTVLLPPVR